MNRIQKAFSAIDLLIVITVLAMVFYHMLSVWHPMFNALLHQNIHLGFSLVLTLLVALKSGNPKARVVYAFLCLVSIAVIVFMHVEQERLDMWAGFPEPQDIVVGLTLVALVFYLTWKSWGSIFPVLVSISILYALFGHHIKGALGHPEFDPKLVLSNLGIGFSGIYGMLLNASANLIFLFIIFGALFEAVGIDRFFIEVGTFLGRHLRGGSAQTAVFSSSFVGMCTGAAAANVALTGSYTIPLMKRTGFKPEHAGAIEAVASTGGQLTPPVMGVAIFLMASFLGVSYSSLMLSALIPAVIYYLTAMVGVIVIASKIGVPMLKADINKRVLFEGLPVFAIPISLVTYLLIRHYTPAYAALVAIFALLIISSINPRTRPTVKQLLQSAVKGAVMAAAIANACASIGMFTSMLTFTGAGPKLAGLIEALSGGNLLLALFFTMILSIILGCAMPTPVAYVVTALVVAPILENMGLNLLTAHLFVFYFAILSAVTPPVAAAAVVGSRLAEADYMRTGWESLKLVAPFFIVPFFIINNPVFTSGSQSPGAAAIALGTFFICWSAFLIACQAYFLRAIRWWERAVLIAVVLLTISADYFHAPAALAASICLMGILLANIWRTRHQNGIGLTVA